MSVAIYIPRLGLGGTFPNPEQSLTMPDGVIVPYGKLVKSQEKDLSLLYNEYAHLN